MTERDYFTVEPTSLTIPGRGAMAIFCGDKPRRNSDGTTSYGLRGPLLLMPKGLWENADETMAKIARILNEHAAEFFDSARMPGDSEATRNALRDCFDLLLEQQVPPTPKLIA